MVGRRVCQDARLLPLREDGFRGSSLHPLREFVFSFPVLTCNEVLGLTLRRPLVPPVSRRVLSTPLLVTSSAPPLPSSTSLTLILMTDSPVWPISDGLRVTVTSSTALSPTASPPPSLNPPPSTPHHPDTGTLLTNGRLLSSTLRPLRFDC